MKPIKMLVGLINLLRPKASQFIWLKKKFLLLFFFKGFFFRLYSYIFDKFNWTQVKINLLTRTIKVAVSNLNCEWIFFSFSTNRAKKETKGENREENIIFLVILLLKCKEKKWTYTDFTLTHKKLFSINFRLQKE